MTEDMTEVRKKPKTLYPEDNDVNIDGYIRLIEGIIISALDKISISAKWHNRRITESMIRHKMENILEIKCWLDSEGCDIWLGIYGRETGRNSRAVKKSLKRTMKGSIRFINKLCRERSIDLKKPYVDNKTIDKNKPI